MDINKALRKQKKSYRRFMLSMSFIFLILPLVLFLTKLYNPFYIMYLLVIEVLILIAIFIRSNNEKLVYEVKYGKVNIKVGLLEKEITIPSDKVEIIHTEHINEDFKLILITSARYRKRGGKPVDRQFLKNKPIVAQRYYKLKERKPETIFFYMIIDNGGIYKYKLLDDLYRNCSSAKCTEEALNDIKFYRGPTQIEKRTYNKSYK